MRNWEKLNFSSEAEERAAFEEFLNEKRSDTIIPVDTDIDEFNLSARTYNSLIRANLTTVGEVYWQVVRLGDNWGNHIRNLGEISQKEAEDVLLAEQNMLHDRCHPKSRIDYLIELLESRGQLLSKRVRSEIADCLRKLPKD